MHSPSVDPDHARGEESDKQWSLGIICFYRWSKSPILGLSRLIDVAARLRVSVCLSYWL